MQLLPLLFLLSCIYVHAHAYTHPHSHAHAYTHKYGDNPVDCASIPSSAFKTYVLKSQEIEAHFIPFGGTLTHFLYADSKGVTRDLVLGYDDPTLYCTAATHPYFCALIGRYANRIANGTFTLDGKVYHTPLNDNNWDTLHGGTIGYDRRVWNVTSYNASSLTLSYFSPNNEMGFPGNLWVEVTYTLNGNEFSISYSAHTDSVTVINLTHHTYWNLNGFANNTETILDHIMTIAADQYVSVDSHLIPTGALGSVEKDYWMNFNTPKAVGKDISHGTVTPTGGYDNAWVLRNQSNWQKTPAVTLLAPQTNIRLELYTDQPSVQFYSGNFLDSSIPRKSDQTFGNTPQFYEQYSSVVLETQDYPDAVNHRNFPNTTLAKGQVYSRSTVFKFFNK